MRRAHTSEHITTALLTQEADTFLSLVQPHDDRATLIALHGDLGAGKTTFVQAVARQLGISESIISPTYVIMKAYSLSHRPFSSLVHIDLYRFHGYDEVHTIGFEDVCRTPHTLVLCEWPERILPFDAWDMRVTFELSAPDERYITYDAHE